MSWPPQTPYLTTDGLVEIYNKKNRFEGIVVIKRKNPPFGFAFPGGFVDRGERVEDALCREMKEEISLDVTIAHLLGVYSDPQRDPRLHTVSVVYIAKAYTSPQAGDDAKEAFVVDPNTFDQTTLVFDHAKILQDYLNFQAK